MFKSKRGIFPQCTLNMFRLADPLEYFIVFPDKGSSTVPITFQLKKGGRAIGCSLTHASALILDLKENIQLHLQKIYKYGVPSPFLPIFIQLFKIIRIFLFFLNQVIQPYLFIVFIIYFCSKFISFFQNG